MKDYHAYKIPLTEPCERLVRLGAAVCDRRDIETRPIDPANLRAEVDRIVDIYNDACAQNWGFLTLTEVEAGAMADTLKLVLDPGLMRFATVGESWPPCSGRSRIPTSRSGPDGDDVPIRTPRGRYACCACGGAFR